MARFANFGRKFFSINSNSVTHNFIWVSSTISKLKNNNRFPRKYPHRRQNEQKDRHKDRRKDNRIDRKKRGKTDGLNFTEPFRLALGVQKVG